MYLKLLWTCIIVIVLRKNVTSVSDFGGHNLICYWKTDSVLRQGLGKLELFHVDSSLCTHIVYLNVYFEYGRRNEALTPYLNLNGTKSLDSQKSQFKDLKKINPNVKLLTSFGRGLFKGVSCTEVARDADLRSSFVDFVVKLLVLNELDGLDLGMEYIDIKGETAEIRENYVTLLQELRLAFDGHGFSLSVALQADKIFIDQLYDLPKMASLVDFMTIMAFDFYSGYETRTGHHSALYPKPFETGDTANRNVDWAVNYLLKKGAPASKVNLGLSSYGRSFTLDRADQHGLGSVAVGAGRPGPYMGREALLMHSELSFRSCKLKVKKPWTSIWDYSYKAPYAFLGDQWVGYDDPDSMGIKAAYAVEKKLRGVAVWTLDFDDFLGTCDRKYPLLSQVKEVLNGSFYQLI